MFAKRVQACIWNSKSTPDQRRNFKALYIFEDGFPSIREAARALHLLKLNPERFVYVCFCNFVYPVCLNSYFNGIVVSSATVYFLNQKFGQWDSAPISDFSVSYLRFVPTSIPDKKSWKDGIVYDLHLIDFDIKVIDYHEKPCGKILTNNAETVFGQRFFKSEICIRTNEYVEHVFAHYFNPKSLAFEYTQIVDLRRMHYEYWNPFSRSTSRTEKDKKAKEKALLDGLGKPQEYERQRLPDGRKVMRESEVHPYSGRRVMRLDHNNKPNLTEEELQKMLEEILADE